MGSSFNKKYNRLNKARYNSMTRPGMGPTRIRDPSVKIAQDWLPLDSFDLQQLKELSANVPTEVHDLRWTGSLEAYDEEFDRITSKKPKTLRRFDNIDSLFVKTSDDPVIEELATEDAGNVFGTDAVIAHIMACTRSALPWDIVATYVAGSIFLDVRDEFEFELHTVNETSNNAPPEGDADAINGHEQLSFEATACHHNFTQQVRALRLHSPAHSQHHILVLPTGCDEETGQQRYNNVIAAALCQHASRWGHFGSNAAPKLLGLCCTKGLTHILLSRVQVLCKSNGKAGEAPLKGEPKTAENPLWDPAEAEEGHEPASLAFRYRSFKLGPGTTVVARTVVHAVSRRNKVTLLPKEAAALGVTERPAYLSCFTLLEYDPKASNTTPWTQIIESQRGNVIATEIKNNAFKLGKAAASAMLAGADFIKLGFLSRPTKSDPDTHAILGISSVPPSQFAQQLGMSTSNAWGILKWFVELVRKHAKNLQEDTPDEEYTAKFVLLRDPNKGAVHLYNVPPETFEGGAEDGAGSDEEGGEGAGWAQDEGAEEA